MASYTEQSVDEWRRIQSRPATDTDPTSQESFSRRRVDSSDIRELGCHFGQVAETFPTQLEFDDDPASLHLQPTDSRQMRIDYFATPASTTAPTTPQPSSILTHMGPYLSPEEIPEFRRQREARASRSRSRRTGSSAVSASSYHSAQDHRAWSDTATSHSFSLSSSNNNINNNLVHDSHSTNTNNISSHGTPYFTPSHTPSILSAGTENEQGDHSGRAPDSPHPYSNFYGYDERFAKVAVEGVDADGRMSGDRRE